MRYLVILGVVISVLMGNNLAMFNAAVEKHDFNRAKALVRPDAVEGNANAMFNLGLLEYLTGSVNNALRWFRRSAEGGVAEAYMGEGIILFSENRNEGSLKKARSAFRRAGQLTLASDFLAVISDFLNGTDRAPADAYYRLASLYHDDPIILSNEPLAFTLMQHAADKGLAAAALDYGKMLLKRGGPESVWNAQKYFHQAALSGSEEARYREGQIFLDGPRGVRNIAKGQDLMAQAVGNGYTKSAAAAEKNAYLPFLSY